MSDARLTAEEIKRRAATINVGMLLKRLEADVSTLEGRYRQTLMGATEDWISTMIPLLEPYLGPPELWVASMATAEGGPILGALTLVAEKAAVGAAERWAQARNATKGGA